MKSDPAASGRSPDEEMVLLKRYAIIAGLVQYEGTVLWNRSQLYLVAHAALLGLVSTKLPYSDLNTILWAQMYSVFGVSLGGLCLAFLWRSSLKSSDHYLDHWLEVAGVIEDSAFDGLQVLRYPGPKHGGRKAAHLTSLLFVILWILVCLFLLFCGFWKMHQWALN